MQYSQPITRDAISENQSTCGLDSAVTKVSPQLRSLSNEPNHIGGKIQTLITSNVWDSNSATSAVVADGLKSLIGRDLFDHLVLAVTQSSLVKGNQVIIISSSSEFKEHIAKKFPNLFSRIGRSKNHVAKSSFHKNFQTRHQKSRRIPINHQDEVNKELQKLLDKKHIKNFLVALTNTLFPP